MPKMKTKRDAEKGSRVTGKGKDGGSKGGGNQGKQEKRKKRLRRLRKNDMVDSTMAGRVKLLLPYR